jgi:hypothetical protein
MYKASYIGIAVISPTIFSLMIGIVWTIVAVKKFEQEVQISVQTAFTMASYVVTAGKSETLGLQCYWE